MEDDGSNSLTWAELILPVLKLVTEPLPASATRGEALQFQLGENIMSLPFFFHMILSMCLAAVLSWIQDGAEDECTERKKVDFY